MFERFKNNFNILLKNYWTLDEKELVRLATKYRIGAYLEQIGSVITAINRKAIIDQLIERDKARYANIAFIAMFFTLFLSLTSAILTALNVWIAFR